MLFIPYGGRTNAEVVIALVAVPIYPLRGTNELLKLFLCRRNSPFIPYGGRTNFLVTHIIYVPNNLSPTGDEQTSPSLFRSGGLGFIPYGGRTNVLKNYFLSVIIIYPLRGTEKIIILFFSIFLCHLSPAGVEKNAHRFNLWA